MRIATDAGPDLTSGIGKLCARLDSSELALEEAPPAANRDFGHAARVGRAGQGGEFLKTASVGVGWVAVAVRPAVFVEIGMADALCAEVSVHINARIGMSDDARLRLNAEEWIRAAIGLERGVGEQNRAVAVDAPARKASHTQFRSGPKRDRKRPCQ